jgi:hypothetical protein
MEFNLIFDNDKILQKNTLRPYIKNKTGKYLKYAIGEIILVVIGILFLPK